MKLSSLTLKRFGPHLDRTVRFADGLTGIVGRNGSGKTTIINAVFAALTNDFSRSQGDKDESVSQLAPAGSNAELDLCFSHGGQEYRVVQRLRPTEALFYSSARQLPVTGSTAVKQALAKILPAAPPVLAKAVFIAQGEINRFLRDTPARRAELYNDLFNLEAAERVWAALGKEEAALQARLEAESGEALRELESLKLQIASLETDQERLSRELAGLGPAATPEQLAEWREIVAQEQRFREAQARRGETWLRLQQLEARSGLEDPGTLEADYAALTQAAADSQVHAEECREALAQWRLFSNSRPALERLERDLAEATLQLDLSQRATPPEFTRRDSTLLLRLTNDIGTAEAELAGKRGFLRKYDRGVPAECPECGTPGVNLETRVEEYRTTTARLEKALAAWRAEATGLAAKRTTAADHAIALQRAKARLDSLQAQRQDFQAVEAPEIAEADARAFMTDFENITKALRELTQTRRRREEQQATYVRLHAQLQATLSELDRQLGQLHVRGGSVETAHAELEREARLAPTRDALRHQQTSQQARLEVMRERQAALQLGIAGQAGGREWLVQLGLMREIVHRSNLPRVAVRHNLQKLSEEINRFLTLFQADFRVEVDVANPEPVFIGRFDDGRVINDARFSWGQQLVLALSFWMSINSMLAGEVGLLCLDEPTANLDSVYRRHLEDTLLRLKQLSVSSGLQVVIVTHDLELRHLFDTVIELS